jgi:MYXO-CTERM domain-containing protein
MKRATRIKRGLRRALSAAVIYGPLTFLLVAGAGCPSLFESQGHREARATVKQAIVGRDGPKTITASGTVVNAYAALAGSDVAAGATTITVADITTLKGPFTNDISAGDLVLIIQMQGATIDTTDTTSYGSVTALGSAGNYELVGVEAVNAAADQITLACPLKHAYTVAGKTQVVRVPQYTTLTIDVGGSITANNWNGTVGGVVAVHAQTTLQLDGSIDASGTGFRGGAADNSTAAAGSGVITYRSANATQGAEKGESIAGYQADYTNGRYGRGAPANGGGGGDSHNGGGGGGANAGNIANWRLGQGVMLNTVTGAAAWALDPGYINNPAGANTRTSAESGGRGGYSYSSTNQDALTVGPEPAANVWGGDNRREVGGVGGHPVANDPASRLFLGGGGGAGDGNNGVAGPGGNGGGLVFVIAGSITGAGDITSNGAAGGDAVFVSGGGDAAGGGGGGGTIVVNAGTISSITISADGGVGGDQVGSLGANEAEGPGGGGGGGYIALSGTNDATLSAAGGGGGTTDRPALSEFPVNGATAGHAGTTSGSAATILYCADLPVTTIATHPTNPSTSDTGSFTFTNAVSPVTYECKLDSGAFAACNASFTTGTLTEGSHTLTVRATDSFGNVEATPPTFTWVYDAVLPLTTIATKPTDPSKSSTGSFTFTNVKSGVTYECKVDSGAFAACTASFTTGTLADGSHTLSVRSTDSLAVVEDPPVTYTWVIDTVPPVTTIATKPDAVSTSPIGVFTFTNSESPVTYECKLDGADFAPCNAGNPSDPGFTTGALADGSHTLVVRSTDAAGNQDASPPTYTWDVEASGIDGGGIDAEPVAMDAEAVDGEAEDAAASPDAEEMMDMQAGGEAGGTGRLDAGRDGIGGVIVDGGGPTVDTGGSEAQPIVDGGGVSDLQAGDSEAGPRDAAADAQATGAEPSPDSAVVPPEPSPDTAPPPAKDDAAQPANNPDAAIVVSGYKVLGGGFCAVAPTGATSPAAFILLGLVSLALLRRRRR